MRLLLAALFFWVGLMAMLWALDAGVGVESGSPWLKPGVVVGFALDTALTWWLFRDRGASTLPRRRLRAIQRSVEESGRLEPDPALDFRFSFTSTQRDLLDAERVQRRERTGMRGWVRALVIGVGLMFLASFAFFGVPEIQRGRIFGPVMWLVMGSSILWFFAVKPLRVRRGIRSAEPAVQELALRFTPRGIDCDVAGVGKFLRRWCELEQYVPTRKGVLLSFTDVINWLPARAFTDRAERARFESSVATRLAQEAVRFQAAPVAHPVLAEPETYTLAEVRHEPGTDAAGARAELTLQRGDSERRLRFDRPLLAAFDEYGLDEGSRRVLLLRVPHPELDGLSVRVLDADGDGHLDLWAEEVVDLGERRAG